MTKKAYCKDGLSSSHNTTHIVNQLSSKKQAPYQPSRIFTLDRINKENDYDKLTYLFRSCTTKDIHNTIQQPILINHVQSNEYESTIRTKSRMRKKLHWINKMLQLTERSNNLLKSLPKQKRLLSSENTLSNVLSLSPCKRNRSISLNKKSVIPFKPHQILQSAKIETKNHNRNYFNGGLYLHKTFNKEAAVDSYRKEFNQSNKKQFCF